MLSQDEQDRIAACVNGCVGIGRPEFLPDLIDALGAVAEALEGGESLTIHSAVIKNLIATVAALEIEVEPGQDN